MDEIVQAVENYINSKNYQGFYCDVKCDGTSDANHYTLSVEYRFRHSSGFDFSRKTIEWWISDKRVYATVAKGCLSDFTDLLYGLDTTKIG